MPKLITKYGAVYECESYETENQKRVMGKRAKVIYIMKNVTFKMKRKDGRHINAHYNTAMIPYCKVKKVIE